MGPPSHESLDLAWKCILPTVHRACRYRMDYMKFVEHHRDTDADITIGCLPCDDARAQDFGLMKINDQGEVIVSPPASADAPLPAVKRLLIMDLVGPLSLLLCRGPEAGRSQCVLTWVCCVSLLVVKASPMVWRRTLQRSPRARR